MNSRLDRGAERCAPLAASEGRGCLLIDSNLNVSPSLFGFGLGFLRRRHDLEQIYIVGTTFLLSSEPLPSFCWALPLLCLAKNGGPSVIGSDRSGGGAVVL